MGVTGWWECYLIKYEEDENVSKDLLNTDLMKGITSVINTIPNLDEESISDLYNKFENIIDDGLITADKEVTTTIEEKKEVTNNLNNHLVDSTSYVSLKETENQRNFYNKRLKIVTINPDSLSFPLNMYDVSTVEERKIGLNYDLIDLAKDMGIEVVRRRITREEIYVADEAFFTGTAAEITPIREVDARVIGAGCRGEITEKIQSAYFDVVTGKNPKYTKYLTYIN